VRPRHRGLVRNGCWHVRGLVRRCHQQRAGFQRQHRHVPGRFFVLARSQQPGVIHGGEQQRPGVIQWVSHVCSGFIFRCGVLARFFCVVFCSVLGIHVFVLGGGHLHGIIHPGVVQRTAVQQQRQVLQHKHDRGLFFIRHDGFLLVIIQQFQRWRARSPLRRQRRRRGLPGGSGLQRWILLRQLWP